MSDKVEWEVVDSDTESADSRAGGPPPHPPTPRDMLQAALGPWWRWKLAALLVAGGALLILLVAVAGVLAVTAITFALLAFVIVRIRNWLRGPGTAPRRRG